MSLTIKSLYKLLKRFIRAYEKETNSIRLQFLRLHAYLNDARLILGDSITLDKKVQISLSAGSTLRIGNNSTIRSYTSIGVKKDASLSIGMNCSINHHSSIGAMKRVEIGDNSMIAPYVTILDWNHRFKSRLKSKREQGYSVGETIIGNDVWIGIHSSVFKGSTIGNGAIIGANCVVRSDILEYHIAINSEVIQIRIEGEPNSD